MKKITIDLKRQSEAARANDQRREALPTVLQQALGVIHPHGHNQRSGNWFATLALRALSEAVVREGCLPVPTAVRLGYSDEITGFADYENPQPALLTATQAVDLEPMIVEVPETFSRLCEDYYKLEPERVAAAIIYSLCLNPPKRLTSRSSDEEQDSGDAWNQRSN